MAQVTSGIVKSDTQWYSTFYVSWNRTSYDVGKNESYISWEAGLITSNNVYWLTNAVTINSIYINGSLVLSNQTYSNISGNGTHKLASGTTTIKHNDDGNKSFGISISGWLYDTGSPSGSGTFELVQIPRYASCSHSLNSKTETEITINWSSDNKIKRVWCSIDGGTTWTSKTYPNSTSGNYKISNLNPNATYSIKTRVQRADSGLNTDSSALSVTTYDYPHITNVETQNLIIGNRQTLTLYNPLSRNVTIKMYKDSASGTQLYSGSTSSTSITITPSANTLYASIPNSQSGICVYSAIFGSNTKTTTGSYTYKIKGTETPTIGTITYEDTNSTVTAITGNNQHIVQNKSNLKVTYTYATAKNSASISKHTFTLNGVTKESTSSSGTVDFGVVNSANNLTLTIKVTDSRGLSSSTTKTITILEHSNPNAIITLNRLNNYEDESYLTVDGSISSVNGKNTMTIKYRYKISGGSYNSFKTINDNEKQTLLLDKNNAYIFNIVITDAFGSTYDKERVLEKGVFPLFIDTVKNSVGINALPRTNNVLEIAGRIIESEKEFSVPVTIGAKTGWYLAMSGSFGYVTNKVFLIAIQQVFSGGAGLLYLNMRNDDNGLKTQRFEWLSQNGIASSNVKLKIEGSSFYLYLKTTANYQQYYIKVLQEKELGGWGFQQYKMYSPLVADTVEEPEGTNPTDFIQTTSTNDGTVIKYPDGTMIINQKYSTTVQSSNWASWGSMFSAKLNNPPNFPVAFVGNKPTVVQTLETDSANASLCTSSESTSISSLTRAGASQVIRPTNPGSTAIFTVHITAIGRWK